MQSIGRVSAKQHEDAQAALAALLTESIQGRGQVVVVNGPVSVGKTELLHRFVRDLKDSGVAVRWATASRPENSIPFGVVEQLLGMADGVVALRAARELCWDSAGSERKADLLHRLCRALMTTADGEPLLLVVDDVHHADEPSLQCLTYVLHRIRSSRVMVVLSGRPSWRRLPAALYAELLHDPRRQVIDLEPLTPDGVAALLGDRPTDEYALTGGNPLLLRALEQDRRAVTDTADAASAGVGRAFGDAVVSCVSRCDPLAVQVASALVVIGVASSPAALGRLLGTRPGAIAEALHELTEAGILADGWFRHPVAASAVLASLPPAWRAATHSEVARLLHSEGQPAPVVARHLVLGQPVDEPWVRPVLHEAAEWDVLAGDPAHSLACLRLAREASHDERQHAETTARLVRVEWRSDPATAMRYLPELQTAIRRGDLAGRYAVASVNYLLWHGRAEEAVHALAALCGRGESDPQARGGLAISVLWLNFLFPEHAACARELWHQLYRDTPEVADRPLPVSSGEVLGAMLARSSNGDAVAVVEQLQRRLTEDGESAGPLLVALSAMIFTERLYAPACWCDPMLEDSRAAPTCQALVSALRAEVAIAGGDWEAAAAHARAGLRAMPDRGWGVVVGSLVGIGVLAETALGRHREAAALLSEIPVPDTMFGTLFGGRRTPEPVDRLSPSTG